MNCNSFLKHIQSVFCNFNLCANQEYETKNTETRRDYRVSGTKQIDAKMMHACNILPKDPDVGEATVAYIRQYTGLTDGQIRYSLKKLMDSKYVELDKQQAGDKGRKCHRVNEQNHITEPGTAWVVERLIELLHWNSDIDIGELIKKLNPPKKFEYLRDEGKLRECLDRLLSRNYIKEVNNRVRVYKKTIEQRLYIQLLAAEVTKERLTSFEFKKPNANLLKARKRSAK